MSNKGFYIGMIVLLACLLAALGFQKRVVGQEGGAKSGGISAVKAEASAATPAPVVAVRVTSSASTSPVFESAALENARLQNDMSWVFGGKTQRGWQLYAPLIASTIETESGVDSGDFAFALSRWQKQNGLEPQGRLDNNTWSRMIAIFQSRRIKDRAYPSADQLVTLQPSECYDPSRPEELRKVERQTYLAYKRMIAAAAADSTLELAVTRDGELAPAEKYLKVISAFRSREYQDQLRKNSPNSGRAGLAVNSPHFTGRAIDIYVGGEPVSTKDENRAIQTRTRAYQWLVKNAARFGFRPYFYEPWHWEYVGEN